MLHLLSARSSAVLSSRLRWLSACSSRACSKVRVALQAACPACTLLRDLLCSTQCRLAREVRCTTSLRWVLRVCLVAAASLRVAGASSSKATTQAKATWCRVLRELAKLARISVVPVEPHSRVARVSRAVAVARPVHLSRAVVAMLSSSRLLATCLQHQHQRLLLHQLLLHLHLHQHSQVKWTSLHSSQLCRQSSRR